MTTAATLSWTPLRRGERYCSPACGGGCTWAAYQRAVQATDDLAEQLTNVLGPGWTPVVRENLGWHGTVVHESTGLEVRAGSGCYFASATRNLIPLHATGATPIAALAQLKALAQEYIAELTTTRDTIAAL